MATKKTDRPRKAKDNLKPRPSSKASQATSSRTAARISGGPAANANASAAQAKQMADLRRIWDDLAKGATIFQFRVSCVRPDDLLVCDFVFENVRLELNGEGAPKLVRKDSSSTILIVEFPPQSFGEQALLDATGEEVSPGDKPFPETSEEDMLENEDNPPDENTLKRRNKSIPTPGDPFPGLALIKIRMAGRSRIAFSMPADESELPFSIEAILDACRRWPMRLSVNAAPDPPRIRVLRPELGFRDLWLGSIVNSNEWKSTTKTLVSVIGDAHEKKLASAARRISRKAVEAIRSGPTRDTEAMLRRAIDEELDVLGEKSAALRDPKRREVAAAALSFMTTAELTKHSIGMSVLDQMDVLPFLRLIFPPHEPPYNVTALELPYRLILSPVRGASQWHHGTQAIARNGRTELWHTRLSGKEKDVGPDSPARVRALWSEDYLLENIIDKVNNNKPFRMSLDPLDREMMVRLMAGFDEDDKNGRQYRPRTAESKRLALSSLGGLLEAEGQWDPPVPRGIGLQQWRHVATLGRDHYVRVVYRGFLCCKRHAASLIKVTERKFESVVPGSADRVAVLRQKFFIAVREREKKYNGTGHVFEGRNFCYTDVEIATRITPTLLAPNEPECQLLDPDGVIYNGLTETGPDGKPRQLGVPRRACFWPMLNKTENFQFEMIGTDRAGRRVPFKMPLLFVGVEANEHWDERKIIDEIIEQYNATPADPRRTARPNGISICYVPVSGFSKGDPRLPTESMVFNAAAVDPDVVSDDEAQFYPQVEHCSTGIPSMQRLLQQPNTVEVKYADAYNNHGFGPGNEGELFLTLVTPKDLFFGSNLKSDNVGGLATPSMSILGLSRLMGPVAGTGAVGLGDITGNRFNPTGFFADAKILGGIDLASLIDGTVTGLDGPEVPKLLSRETDDTREASFDWSTSRVKKDKDNRLFPNVGGTTTLDMHAVVSARKDSDEPTFSATATLVNFKVNVGNAVVIWFDRLQYSAKTGSKPDVLVDLHPTSEAIQFIGALEFVNDLRNIIPSNGFSDPPGISVTPSGISASYSLSIPSIAIGIFALEHISLGAGFLLPFDAKPAEVRFNFCERQRPFSLTVSFLGGGGFFAICLGTEGVREVEAALEFGAALSINLGVASGSVEVKAGVYYHWKTTLVELEGYVRLHGELSVLGLISASLTFYLKLGYTKQNRESVVWGEASLEVEIEILFLSFSVSVKCRREFGGSAGDPKFIELIPDQLTWNEYCEAFAGDV